MLIGSESSELERGNSSQCGGGWPDYSRILAMTHLFWNCRGLGSNTVVQALHRLIRKHRPSMIFLSETKMKDHRVDGVRRRMGFARVVSM